jgi:hypothetical protein
MCATIPIVTFEAFYQNVPTEDLRVLKPKMRSGEGRGEEGTQEESSRSIRTPTTVEQ